MLHDDYYYYCHYYYNYYYKGACFSNGWCVPFNWVVIFYAKLKSLTIEVEQKLNGYLYQMQHVNLNMRVRLGRME